MTCSARSALLTVAAVALCSSLCACDTQKSDAQEAPTAVDGAVHAGVAQCRSFAGRQLGTASIEKTEWIERGEQTVGFFRRMVVKILVPVELPDFRARTNFCRVTAKLRPVPDSEITAQIWFPEQWNGKLFGTGGGGFNGGLSTAALPLASPVAKGYAAFANDVGHDDTESAKFTQESHQKYLDYAFQGNHEAVEFARKLSALYYGEPVKRAYFHGCSNGGRDALMAARRFPNDYDGIIAGAPAAGWSKLATSFAWNTQASLSMPKLKDKLGMVQAAVIAKCDALDGVKDQLLENPSACSFDPAVLQCKGADGADCLNATEVSVLNKLYGGPHLRDGTKIYAGMPVGGEGLKMNWDEWLFKSGKGQNGFAQESFRWMVYGDPKWELSQFDINRDYPLARERMGAIMDSDDPDLSGFTARGGKLLMYHGWNDAAIPAGATQEYHTRLKAALGPIADRQIRLFMVPGMMHCAGGVGPTTFDALGEMDRWVESGTAPDRMGATEYDPPAVFGPVATARPVRTRPLCPWPKVARYAGSGSTDEAKNFNCQ